MVGGDGERMSEARIRYRCLLRALKQRNECVVCMDAPRAVTLAPCNHHITCVGCTQELIRLKKSCPFCDKPIVEFSTAKWSTAK